MARNRNRYKQMERYMTYAMIADGVLFILYLLFAGFGITWLKVITAILAILLSGLCLYCLYMSKELLRQRSLWMTVGAAAVIICILASLVLNFPSPKPTAASPDSETPHHITYQL